MALALLCFYGLFAFVALVNLLLIPRAKPGAGDLPVVLIPARNEEKNLASLVPALKSQGFDAWVLDDQSEDRTAQVAAEAGALVIRGQGPPPESTGKSWACHTLALHAAEGAKQEWMLFLDADVQPGPQFGSAIAGWLGARGRRFSVATGFPRFLPGRGLEPAYLSWMTWMLLCTNPFGLVSATGKGHNLFLNGQVVLWRQSSYQELQPHRAAGTAVLEDVRIGRILGKKKVPVEVLNLSSHQSVQMYDCVSSAWRGMVKNSAEIAGPGWPSVLLAGFLLAAAWGWTAAGSLGVWCLGLLILSRLMSNGIVRHPWWVAPLIPLSLTLGAATVLTSSILHRRGGVEWKGRFLRTGPRKGPQA